jgi:hypothetical protein
MRRTVSTVLVFAALYAVDAAAQAPDVQQAVDRFYPAERLNTADLADRRSCAQVLGTTPSGDPDIVIAAYADRDAGAVRVLRRAPAGEWALAAETAPEWMLPGTRTRCTIRLNDLDFDGQREVFVNFDGVRAAVGWVFRWNGARLVSLTPTRADGDRQASILLDPAVYDLEHSGPLRVVAARQVASPAPGVPPPSPAFIYKLGPAGLEAEAALLAIMGFRADVDPRGNQRSFRPVTDSVGPFTVRVINGDRSGARRVTGATIRVNDREALGPAQVHESAEFTTMQLPSLLVQNQVTATLTGPPDAFIIVVVQDSTRR